MFHGVPEKQMHFVRWLLVSGWLLLIVSLFYDPISPYLTQPTTEWSIFRLSPDLLDPVKCKEVATVQGKCIDVKPFAVGAKIFWGIVIPCGVMILIVFGHETWRRICPLSFLSQIPRALGKQRQRKITNPRTGAVRYELAKVLKDSWLGRNHLYFQFGFLCIGLCLRILFINSDRLFLGSFLLLTILSAILVGYLYAGKTWCQYICPMGPVQMVYNGPRGLFGSEAHQGQKQIITQSMCRAVDKEGSEKSTCVSCQSPCMDIDAERSYWEVFNKPGRRFVQYGYVGLVVGFYLYYFLYSGTFDYYYSGVWSHEENQLATLFAPGFYIFGQSIPIPKLVAVPLTIGAFVIASYFLFSRIEKAYKADRQRINKPLSQQQVQHIIFSISTFLVFNIYFLFAGRPILKQLPTFVELGFNALVILVSTVWLYRTIARSAETYSRESLAESLRRQLSKLTVDFSKFLEGRTMEELKPDEVYVLAKVLPSFSKESSFQVYKGLLREELEQGNIDPANSLEGLKQIRLELGIKDEEHYNILTELGVENPDLLDPSKRRSRENQLRIENYRQALELQLLDLVETGVPLRQALQSREKQIQALKQEYGITAEEQAQILGQITDENSAILRKAEMLLEQLKQLTVRDQILSNLVPNPSAPVYILLRLVAIHNKEQIVTKQLLNILEVLGDAPEAVKIANAMGLLADNVLPKIFQESTENTQWQERLSAKAIAILQSDELEPATLDTQAQMVDDEIPTQLFIAGQPIPKVTSTKRQTSVIEVLKELLQELEPLVQAAALHALAQLDPQQSRQYAHQLLNSTKPGDWLVKETAENILGLSNAQVTTMVQTLIVQVMVRDTKEQLFFQQPAIQIGRSVTNDIILPSPKVSQQHAILQLDEQKASVTVLKSAYGLRINDKRERNNTVRLNQGDVIRFSQAEEPSITVNWKKQASMQSVAPSERLSTLEKLFLLFETSLLRTVKPEALIELARQAEIRVYTQGEMMCKAGEPSNELLLLIDGEADVTVLRGESEVVINMVRTGETIGEMGVISRQPRSANVVAKAERNRALVIETKDFEAVLRNDPDVSRSLLLNIIGRLQRLTTKVTSQS
ncbi:cyclic nucleotide-binding domain-containing protein [Nostoc favosum]|uniref:Cyclic nucleotide-binding domain-containing protein n=1 Tax=Nostoc favosum CHAB5714 TaxID=2780399 RepID=A0ABS8IE98_9NOSO|nr:cyclic nucleotide-binding domain-containing protein [Nostoc favosum]MCC5602209.1 cyclic nucleotide-binding domain-containing protein [Nostoc favosum CHAB5714]